MDAGNLLFKAGPPPATAGAAEAARIRAAGVVAIYRAMGLRHAGIGARDLAVGPAFLHSLAGGDFTWLSLNLYDSRGERPLFPGFTLDRAGELSVAVLALTDHRDEATRGAGDYSIRPWQEVLPGALAQLRSQADILVLLSNYPLSENQAIVRLCPEVDLIFQAGHVMGNVPPIRAGNALISQSESRGRYVGLLELDWQGRGRWQERGGSLSVQKGGAVSGYRQRFLPLGTSMPDSPALEAQIRQVEERAQAAAAR